MSSIITCEQICPLPTTVEVSTEMTWGGQYLRRRFFPPQKSLTPYTSVLTTEKAGIEIPLNSPACQKMCQLFQYAMNSNGTKGQSCHCDHSPFPTPRWGSAGKTKLEK